MPEYYGPDIITTLAKRLRPYMMGVGESISQANEWDKIIHIISNGGGANIYDPTVANFVSALSSANSGDLIWMPPCTLNGDFNISAGIGLASMGNNCVIDGKLILSGANSFLLGITVANTSSAGSALIGVDCSNSSGTVYINNSAIYVENSGTSDAYGIKQSGAGNSIIWDSNIYGNASGGGNGYGIHNMFGNIYMEGGWLRGSTAPAIST